MIQEKVPFTFPLELLKQVESEGQFHVVGYAATTDFDLQGDIITEEALQNASLDLIKNSTVLLNHELARPIGKVTKVDFDRHGLLIDALISQTEPEIIQKIKEGVLNKFSIRGQVLEREKKYMREYDRVVNVILKIALVEVSLVSVPANPEARAIGWYLSKALENQPPSPEGGNSMSKERNANPPEKPPEGTPDAAQAPDGATPAPNVSIPDPGAPAPEAVAEAEAVAAEVQKNLVTEVLRQVQPVFVRKDDLDKTVTEAVQKAFTGDARKALVEEVRKQVADELSKLLAAEVQKQLEPSLKALPVLRKGLVPQDSDPDDAKKTFEKLPPEQKLRVALALEQA